MSYQTVVEAERDELRAKLSELQADRDYQEQQRGAGILSQQELTTERNELRDKLSELQGKVGLLTYILERRISKGVIDDEEIEDAFAALSPKGGK